PPAGAVSRSNNRLPSANLGPSCVRAQCLPGPASMDDRASRAGDGVRNASTSTGRSARPAPSTTATPSAPKVVQPKPQALSSRSGPSSILVSPRQKGNPILNSVKSTAWEYSDIPADYVLGATTCALFLSLKYHRLHPEYIYNRIRDLKGQYDLRIVLTMVDVENHEDSLRELSKTSLVNNVTIMLCWSAQEAGRYLELFKTFEHAAPTSIRAKQSSTYSENMVEFITVPRGINKTDAVGLVSNFGSIRTAINAGPEEIGLIAGWGDKKVQRWCNAVKEPFRVKKAARRGLTRESTQAGLSRDTSRAEGESQILADSDIQAVARQRLDDAVPVALDIQEAPAPSAAHTDADLRPDHRPTEVLNHLEDDEQVLQKIDHAPQPAAPRPVKRKQADEDVCCAFRDNAEPTLFRYVIATARYQSLGVLQKVALFPVFRKHVREIVFDGSVYDQILATREVDYYREAARHSTFEQDFSYHKHGRWKRYAQLYQEQEEMKSDGVLVQTISRALEWLPNITRITYSPHPHHLPIEAKDMQNLVSRTVTISSTSGSTCSDHPFRQLIAALYMSHFTGVRELRTEPLGSNPGTEFALGIFDLNEDEMAAAKFFFRHLEKVALCMAIYIPHAYSFNLFAKFATLLRTSTELQYLHFHPTRWNSPHLLPRLGMQATWPKLQSLSLERVLVDDDEILNIIKRHKKLTSVRLKDCSLFKGVWADVVDEIVFSTKLVTFSLDCVSENVPPDLSYSTLEKESWKYEGHIAVMQGGDRSFVETNPAKKSIYDSRKYKQAEHIV
ncbi:DNA excision repair protein ercc-1, partial [Stagonosporopsis vannaccii]